MTKQVVFKPPPHIGCEKSFYPMKSKEEIKEIFIPFFTLESKLDKKIYLVDIKEEISKGNLAVGKLEMPVSIGFAHQQQSLLHKDLGEAFKVKKGLQSVANTFAVAKSLFITKVLLAWITRSNTTCKVQV